MVTHSSATQRKDTPRISDALKRRAQSLINNRSIDAQSRAVIRYASKQMIRGLLELFDA